RLVALLPKTSGVSGRLCEPGRNRPAARRPADAHEQSMAGWPLLPPHQLQEAPAEMLRLARLFDQAFAADYHPPESCRSGHLFGTPAACRNHLRPFPLCLRHRLPPDAVAALECCRAGLA